MMKFRTQYDDRLFNLEINFPVSVVQPGMSPDVAQMVRSRAVGGNLDEYVMNGISSDAPFESEYVEFFDMQDMAQQAAAVSDETGSSAVERQNAEKSSPGKEAPPKTENADNQQNSE